MAMLNPNDSVADWVVDVVPTLGAGWCPPGILGLGLGGTAEKAMLLAKQALLAPIDMPALRQRGPQSRLEELRLEIFERVNELGIGAQGLGGLTTVLDVKILDYPTHAASLPVGLIPNCAATRHAHFTLDGSGPARQTPPSLEDWPKLDWEAGPGARRVNLETLRREDLADWRPGETLLLSGKLLTGRDAAHKKLQALARPGGALARRRRFQQPLYLLCGTGGRGKRQRWSGRQGLPRPRGWTSFTDMMLEKTGPDRHDRKSGAGPPCH